MEKIATGRSPARLLSPAMDVLLRLGEWSRRRHVKASCGPLSDALLRDMGLIRVDVEAALDPQAFFRANRQTLVAAAAVRRFVPAGKGRLVIELSAPGAGEVAVPQERAAEFKRWISR
jgi:uncharacterized protein YjiS (DUF1127 family)